MTDKFEPGINIEYYIKNANILRGTLYTIGKRILSAAGKFNFSVNSFAFVGIDVNNPRVNVTWRNFLDLYCTFESGQHDKKYLIRFWQKFFDTQMSGICQEPEYMTLLEELVRGICLQDANKTTRLFAEMY